MKRRLLMPIAIVGLLVTLTVTSKQVDALTAESSAPETLVELQVAENTGYQDQAASPQQAVENAVLQAEQIERSLLTQYTKETDLIVGTYRYGSLKDLKLTRLQAEIIKNGYVPILGKPGDAPVANPEKDYVEYDCGSSCSGGRAIMQCSTTPMAYEGYKTEYEVMVKGSKYGVSNGGYVCAGPNSIKSQCSGIYEHNPCINGTYQLDNDWLLSIGVDTAEIRRQIEARKYIQSTPLPPQPTPEVQPTLEPQPSPAPSESAQQSD